MIQKPHSAICRGWGLLTTQQGRAGGSSGQAWTPSGSWREMVPSACLPPALPKLPAPAAHARPATPTFCHLLPRGDLLEPDEVLAEVVLLSLLVAQALQKGCRWGWGGESGGAGWGRPTLRVTPPCRVHPSFPPLPGQSHASIHTGPHVFEGRRTAILGELHPGGPRDPLR